jgi:hypothetical protein
VIGIISGGAVVEEIWVNLTEGAEITGYNRDYVRKLAKRVSLQPEGERLMKLRRRSNGIEIWLPDLIAYVENHGHGPYPKRKEAT